MFIIEDVEVDPADTLLNNNKDKIADLKHLMEFESFVRLDSINYEEIMNKEQPLLSKDTEVN